MNILVLAFLSIIFLFIVGLGIKSVTKWRFCAICVSISSTWIVLLVLFILDIHMDKLLIGILMGQSITGLYYLLKKNLPEEYQLFRLPYILTGTLMVYAVLIQEYEQLWIPTGLVIGLWLIFGILYAIRKCKGIKNIAAHIIACCRDW